MRRLLAVCGVTVLIYAAFAAAPKDRAGTASAAGSGSGSIAVPDPPGCPLGPSFTFCNQVPGLTSAAEDFLFTLAHPTNGLTFSFAAVPGYPGNFAAGDFSIQSTTCNAKLNAGDSCDFVVSFTPTTVGLRQARLTITNPTGDITYMNVEGTGSNIAMQRPAPPGGCTQDNAFTYCDQDLNTQSGVQTFTLSSANAITGLNVTLAAVPGLTSEFDALKSDFMIEGTSTCGAALGAGGSCTIDVAFTPQTAGLREAALTATDDQSDSVRITLAGHTTSGLAISQPAGYASNCFPAAGFQLCTEPIAGSAPPKTLILTNNSGTMVTGLALPAPTSPVDFPVANSACTTTLAAGASCSFGIGFTPQGAGLRQAPVSITDAQGDVAVANFAGTADDFSVEIVPGQTDELSVAQGATVTFMAQATADSVFGQNGEQLSLVCPTNLPKFTTCAFSPCPVIMTPGTATPFGIVFVTSSERVPAPPVANPCPGTATANTAPGGFDSPRGPSLVLHVAPRTSPHALRFPAPGVIALVLLATLGAMAFALFGVRGPARKRVPLVFGVAGLAVAILLGCGGRGSGVSTATPTGTTKLNILANATDSSGNPLNASRAFQITLDVVTK